MNVRTLLSILTAKAVLSLSKFLFKGGSSFPGKVALAMDPSILWHVAKGIPVILITGTNGKTTTASLLAQVLEKEGYRIIHNATGANMYPGITASFIDAFRFREKKRADYAVIEVDEANVKFITKVLEPKAMAITNLFRDQLDRYGEVYTTLHKILEGVDLTKETLLVLNGDESLLGALSQENPKRYFGFSVFEEGGKELDQNADAKFCKVCQGPYAYDFVTYNHLGKFYCPNCGYKRPSLDVSVDALLETTPSSSTFVLDNERVTLPQGGLYNIYNALCAYTLARELGIDKKRILSSFSVQESAFGRQEVLQMDQKEVHIFLVKNPAGYNQALDTVLLTKEAVTYAFLLNDQYADGRDVSWIFDVQFENLQGAVSGPLFIGGDRRYDMAVRLQTAGLDPEQFHVLDTYEAFTKALQKMATEKIYIFATYTAMLGYRKHLHKLGYIKKLW